MTVVVYDDFERASLGPDWTALNIGINAGFPGELRVNTTGTSNYAIYTAAQTANDSSIEATFANPQINFGLNLRCTADRTTRYMVEVTGPTLARIRKLVGGTSTVLVTGTVPAGAVGDKLKFEVIGNVLTAYMNGVVVLTATDSSINGSLGNYAGLTTFASASNLRLADVTISSEIGDPEEPELVLPSVALSNTSLPTSSAGVLIGGVETAGTSWGVAIGGVFRPLI